MHAPTAPTPASLSHPEADPGDLDTRILLAEQRLIAREENLQRALRALGARARDAVQPWRKVGPWLGGALGLSGLAGFWWFWRGRAPAVAASAPLGSPGAAPAAHAGGRTPWVSLVALGWPMLPASWRSRISPATASTLVAVGLPLASQLLQGRKPPPLPTMPMVDLGRFAGTWHELARLPAHVKKHCDGRVAVHFRMLRDGGLEVFERCVQADQRVLESRGVAQPVQGSGGAQLKLSLWPAWLRSLPLAWSERWILHVDDEYSMALVGNPERDDLRIYARRRSLAPERLQWLLQIARDRGFAVERLQFAQRR